MIFRIFLFWFLISTSVAAETVRLKDIATFEGIRSNPLIGYGLIVGLNGTGDSIRSAPYTKELLSTILERLGVNTFEDEFRTKNIAAVIVTATLPPFARKGTQIDVNISTIGDAKSIRGGSLVLTPLSAADGRTFAVAQGAVVSSGVAVDGDAAAMTQGVPTAGTIPSGAIVEREIDFDLTDLSTLSIALKEADFRTVQSIEQAINTEFRRNLSIARDSRTIDILLDNAPNASVSQLLARIEHIEITAPKIARIVVDQRSGTVVISESVRISRVAISKENLILNVEEAPIAIQPNPFSEGESLVVSRSEVDIENDQVVALSEFTGATFLSDIVTGLNALGLTSNDLIDILMSIKAVGALHADLIIL